MKTLMLTAAVTASFMAPAAAQDKAREEVENKLKSIKITLDFKETTLDVVLEYLREISGINMLLDAKVREKQSTVTIKVSDISLRSVFSLILNPLDCGTLYRDGVIMVMLKPDIQDQTVKMELYDCRDLLHAVQDFPGVDLSLSADGIGILAQDQAGAKESEINLEEIVKTHTGGRTWEENPKAVCRLQNGILIVRQSADVHRQVARLLDMLRRNK